MGSIATPPCQSPSCYAWKGKGRGSFARIANAFWDADSNPSNSQFLLKIFNKHIFYFSVFDFLIKIYLSLVIFIFISPSPSHPLRGKKGMGL
jgi:hypothetical protein